MPDTFDIAINFVLRAEGSLSVDPRDPGGMTKFGISKHVYPDVDIANLTRDDAVEIYRRDYWERYGVDRLPPILAVAVLDGAINQGPIPTIMALQRTLGVLSDGVIGVHTAEVASIRNDTDTLADFLARRAVRYAQAFGFESFGHGWMRRLFDLYRTCIRLCEQPNGG